MAVSARRQKASSGPEKKGVHRTIAGLTGLAVLVCLVLWITGVFSTPKEVLEIRALVDAEVAKLERVARNEVPFADDRSQFGEVFGRMRDLPEGVRDQVREEVGRLFRARERAEFASYFALPPNKRQAELDRRIKAEMERRRAWEQERASRAANPGANGAVGQGRAQGQALQPVGGQPQVGGNGGGRPVAGPSGRRSPRTDEQILARRKERLDQSSPEERARSAEYRRAMAVRRAQLGISPERGRGA